MRARVAKYPPRTTFHTASEEAFSETRRSEIIDEAEAFLPYSLSSTTRISTAGSYIDVVGHIILFSYVALRIAEHRKPLDRL